MKTKIIRLVNPQFDEVRSYLGKRPPVDIKELFIDIPNGNLYFDYDRESYSTVKLNWSTRKNGVKSVRIAITK